MAEGPEAASSLLLADAHDAMLAYERLAKLDDPEHRTPEVKLFGEDACNDGSYALANGKPNEFDAIVLGCATNTAPALMGKALRLAAPSRLIYVIVATPNQEPEAARDLLQRLRALRDGHDLAWGGALVVADSPAIASLVRAPRMGFWRRPVSEAVDELVFALRCGANIASVSAHAAGVIVAQPRRPPWLRWPKSI